MTDLEVQIEALINVVGRGRYETELKRLREYNGLRLTADRREVCREVLAELCISPNLTGHDAIIECVELLLEDGGRLTDKGLTKEIYPPAGERLGLRWSSVEHNARRAIEKGWAKCPERVRKTYFGSVGGSAERPTTGAFLIRVAMAVQKRMTRVIGKE